MKYIHVIFLLLLPHTLFSQKIDQQKIDDYINYIENNDGGIGSLSIFKDGKEVYNRSFGQEKLLNVPYNRDTKYQIASVTKMVTAILTWKLIEDDKLKLDTKLADFFPEIPNSEKITIKNMLEHTSGLGNFAVRNGAIWVIDEVDEKEILEEIKKQGVSFGPNEKVVYSNSAYILLRKIVEQKYGKPYNEIVQKEIAEPLGLKNFASVKSNPTNLFKSYQFKEKWTEIKDIAYTNVIGVGDIASSTKDMNILINRLFQNKILMKGTLEYMKPLEGKEDWGRGLALFPFDEHLFFGHNGDVLGSHSRLIYNPKDKISVAYSTNGERIPANTVVENIVNIIYNKSFALPEIK